MKKLIFLISLFIFISCEKENSPSYPEENQEETVLSNGIVLQKRVINISPSDLSKISEITPHSISFSNPSKEILNLKIGDKIIGITTQYGVTRAFSREITGLGKVNNSKSIKTFFTKIVGLAEIIKEGKITFNKKLFSFIKPLEKKVLYDGDNNKTNDLNQVNTFTSINFSSNISGYMKFKKGIEFQILLDLLGRIDFSLFANLTKYVEKEEGVITHLTPVLVWATPPITISPYVGVMAKFEGNLIGDLKTGFIDKIDFNALLKYDGDWSLKSTKDPNKFIAKKTVISVSTDAKATFTFLVALVINEITGPSVNLKPFLALDAKINRTPFWILSGGFDGSIGSESGFLARGLPELEYDFNIATYELARSKELNSPPIAKYTFPNGREGSISNPFMFDAIDSYDKETPKDRLKFRWDFDGDGTWDSNYESKRFFSYQYSIPGTFYPILQVLDEGGLTAEYSDPRGINISNPINQNTITLQPGPNEGFDGEIEMNTFSTGSISYSGDGSKEILVAQEFVLNTGSNKKDILIKFKLPSEINSKHIISAKLKLYSRAYSDNSSTVNVSFSKMNSSWSEENLKWDPNFSSSPFSQEIFSSSLSSFNLKEVDITSLVQNWVNGERNNGLRISVSPGNAFYASSSDNPHSLERPKLVITFE